MEEIITIERVGNSNRLAIVELLKEENLPADDLSPSLDTFLIATDQNKIVGVVGYEKYNNYGLLRSLVVKKHWRDKRIAGRLVEQLEKNAKSDGIEILYLLTETAPDYFFKKGFEKIERTDVPDNVKQSSEFSHVCPTSAIVMRKNISEI